MAWSASSLLALSLHGELARFETVEPCMGSLFKITVFTEHPEQVRQAFERAHELDRILSDYKPDSELNELCRRQRAIASADLYAVLASALDIAKRSHGAFDPTVGPIVRRWREARKTHELPSPNFSPAGWRLVHLNPQTREVRLERSGMQLDLGGIAKGYAAQQMLIVLRRMGMPRALVAASGDLAIGDPPPGAPGWRVRIGDEVRTMANCAVSTSGDDEQFVEIGGVRYSHIVDPRTGLGLTGQTKVTVIAPDGALADGLATAISVLGGKEGRKLARQWPNVELLVHPD